MVSSLPKRHILSVSVEDYFHADAVSLKVHPHHWSRLETHTEANTRRVLDLLDAYEVKATFFTLGWVAEHMPEVVREIAQRGHEVASKGYVPQDLRRVDPLAFRDDLRRSREVIEAATGQRVLGHRVARGSLGVGQLWALDALAEEGFAYDSSVYPRLRSLGGEAWRRFPHLHEAAGRTVWEVPLSSWHLMGVDLPASGGAALRQLPPWVMRQSVRAWDRRFDTPFNLYFHVWELDPQLPRISAVGPLDRARLYRNLDRMEATLRDHCGRYAFVGISDYLGLGRPPAAPPKEVAAPPAPVHLPLAGPRPQVTVVVPFFNEEPTIPYFLKTLEEIEADFEERYDVRWVFVDDASTDDTWRALEDAFGGHAHVSRVRHDANQGVAGAIATGIRAATTEIVCSMDCDCTYDPAHLLDMIPLLTPEVDLVTASPYHPAGAVWGVHPWRLMLSKGLSRLYSAALSSRLHTYTSCCRVYRRSSVVDLPLENGGFLGVAELLIRLSQRGGRIVEHPATLETRLFGESKMKIANTVAGHLGLLGDLLVNRTAAQRIVAEPQP